MNDLKLPLDHPLRGFPDDFKLYLLEERQGRNNDHQ